MISQKIPARLALLVAVGLTAITGSIGQTTRDIRDGLNEKTLRLDHGSWTFRFTELIEIDIVSRTPREVVADIRTGDAPGTVLFVNGKPQEATRVEGRIRIRLAAGKVSSVENMSAIETKVPLLARRFDTPPQQGVRSTPTAETPQQQAYDLLNGSIAVNAGKVWRNTFAVYGSGHVYGRFQVQGGANNDVYCYIVTEDEYQNLINGNRFNYLYSSGKVTVATIDVTLGPGSYILAFSNGQSIISSKSVYGQITLTQ